MINKNKFDDFSYDVNYIKIYDAFKILGLTNISPDFMIKLKKYKNKIRTEKLERLNNL